MKILVTHFGIYKKSGWGRTFEEARGLVKLGHQVTLLCSLPGFGGIFRQYYEEGVKIVAFYDIIPVRFLSSGFGCLSLLFKSIYVTLYSFDVCLANSHRDSAYYPCAINRFFHHSRLVVEWWDNFKVKQERGMRVVNSSKDPIKRLYHRITSKRELRREVNTKLSADFVVTLSSVTSQRAEEIGISPNRIRVVRGGCDVEHVHYFPQPARDIKLRNGIPDECLTFGFIGDGDQELPDLEVFLEALVALKDKYHVKFLNYGKPIKEAQKENPELASIIHNCGWVDYYGDNSILSATDVFVLIKQDNVENQSGWPNKLGDYLACGRPIIVNPYGEVIPFIKEWNPGIVHVQYSKESIESGIAAICGGSFDVAELGKRNYSVAKDNSWANKAKELEAIFVGLTSS